MVISYRGRRLWAFRDRPARHADGGVIAFVVINLATMIIPITCLWISRGVLGLDDPLSDNLSANVVGLMLGRGARFFLFRDFVFQRPIAPRDLRRAGCPTRPGAGRSRLGQRVGRRVRSESMIGPFRHPTRATSSQSRSTTGPAPPPARGAAAG